MDEYEIPQHVDAGLHFFFWEADAVAPIGLGLFVGVIIGSPAICTAIGWLAASAYSRFRDSQSDGFALHFLYWQGIYPVKARTTPNPFARHFRP